MVRERVFVCAANYDEYVQWCKDKSPTGIDFVYLTDPRQVLGCTLAEGSVLRLDGYYLHPRAHEIAHAIYCATCPTEDERLGEQQTAISTANTQ